MEGTSVLINNEENNVNQTVTVEEIWNEESMENQDMNDINDLFSPFYKKFLNVINFLKDTKENKNELEDEINENLVKTLYNLCEEFLKYIRNINNFGNYNLNEQEQESIIEAYEKFVRQCKEYNENPKVKELEDEISNLLDLLFNNTSEAVNTLFSADSFFDEHIQNLKLKLNERNQKIQFENERVKKIELEKQIEEYDETCEANKKKNIEMDETINNLEKEINKLKGKMNKYENYIKKKRKETDLDFSDTYDNKDRIRILEENIKMIERNIKSTQLSPLKIIEQTPYQIIFEFQTPRNVMQFKVTKYDTEDVQVEIIPCDQNMLAYINQNLKNCSDVSQISYLIKEAIYLNFLDL